jgi:serine/threonine protein kinase
MSEALTAPKYRRIVELGHGGMAVVHLAAMRSSHNVTKLVVIKELEPSLATDPDVRQMFLEEARLAARLNHPNVIQMFEVVDHVDTTIATRGDGLEGTCAIVMEYLDGQPLNHVRVRLKSDPTAVDFFLAVLVDALTGLEYAHTLTDYDGRALGLVHRDVSPHNIFVTYSGEVKVLDFGIAKANDSAMRPTDVGVVKGKLSYMAPEQARGERVDARADVFACGVILWEAIVGKRLWAGINDAGIMYKLHTREIPMPRDVKPDVPEALDAICRRALACDAKDRFQSAGEFRDAIESYLDATPGRLTRRAVGERMVRMFEAERSQVRQVVEKQLGRMANASAEEFTASPISDVVLPHIADSSVSGLGHTVTATGPTKATSTLSVTPSAPTSKPPVLLIAVGLVALISLSLTLFVLLRTQGPTTNANAPTTSAPPPITPPVTTSAEIATTTVEVPSATTSARPAHVVGKSKLTATPTTATASPTDVGY